MEILHLIILILLSEDSTSNCKKNNYIDRVLRLTCWHTTLQIRQNDRLAVSKLVTSLTRGNVRSPLAQCLLIRYTSQVRFP